MTPTWMRKLAHLILLQVYRSNIQAIDADKQSSDIILELIGKLNKSDDKTTDSIVDFLGVLAEKIDKLEESSTEHKIVPLTEQTNPELDKLKSDLIQTRAEFAEHRQTLDELEVMRQNKFQKWVQQLEKKKKPPDGR